MRMFYALRCSRCGSTSEPKPGCPQGPLTVRVCGQCLTPQMCLVMRLTEDDLRQGAKE